MLHSCSFPGCDTRTLSTYCWEHELLIRNEIEAERENATNRERPVAREFAALNATTAQPELPTARPA
jgi:hypothetical protein